ncbi:MAG: T9SS type A sorting domain-containing protein [Flavobacteriales bacterium]|nr:T9SS type A sorting domain-containing protein [Flavobacteriales bacterium]
MPRNKERIFENQSKYDKTFLLIEWQLPKLQKKVMRSLLKTILLWLSANLCFAQNWQMFPLDSLRVFVNETEQISNSRYSNLLSGIDFRDYQTNEDTTIIDLARFARAKSSDISMNQYGWYYDGMSNFGSKIVTTPSKTTLIFTSKYGSQKDSLIFLRTPEINNEWVVFNNSDLEINAKVMSKHGQDGDSILTISLEVKSKNRGIRNFLMEISKEKGLLKSPVFYDILMDSEDLSSLKEVDFIGYKEKTKKDFFFIEPGTEFQLNSLWETDGTRYELSVFNDTSKYIVYHHEHETKWHEQSQHYYFTYSDGYHGHTDFVQEADDSTIANPLPSQRFYKNDTAFHPSLFVNGYFTDCGKQVITKIAMPIKPYVWISEDSIVVNPEMMDLSSEWFDYMESVGLVRYYLDAMNSYYSTDLGYAKFPNGCEMGEKHFRFTSVENRSLKTIDLYPNPTTDFINLDIEEKVNEIMAVSLDGRQTVLIFENDKIDVSKLESGIYVVEIKTDSGVLRGKVVKL